jgi:hypothetical protein
MKRVLNLVAVVVLIFVGVTVSNASNTIKQTDSFTIVANDDVALNNVPFQKSWTIAYGDAGKNVVVLKRTTKKGEEYLVRNEFFEVRYLNTEKGFGVRLVRNADSKVDYTINSLVLNEAMMAQQSLIWSEMLTEQKALEYIADFVPTLLNENYKHLLN